jgi:uracil phosphoribosyltransferase
MQQVLIVLGMFLTSNLIAYTVHCIKNHNKDEKIEIMSVRSELRKIDKINEADKKSMF